MPESVVASGVGIVLSFVWRQHVVSEVNYYYSWYVSWTNAKKAIFNCIILSVNSWIKVTRKSTFIGLTVQYNTLWNTYRVIFPYTEVTQTIIYLKAKTN